jgi:hypothetical protein
MTTMLGAKYTLVIQSASSLRGSVCLVIADNIPSLSFQILFVLSTRIDFTNATTPLSNEGAIIARIQDTDLRNRIKVSKVMSFFQAST